MVESFSHSLISARREDLQIEEPVTCRHSPAFHFFYPTLTGMLGAPLIRIAGTPHDGTTTWQYLDRAGRVQHTPVLAPRPAAEA